jgi:hypothetical protein
MAMTKSEKEQSRKRDLEMMHNQFSRDLNSKTEISEDERREHRAAIEERNRLWKKFNDEKDKLED